mgnify:FL=1
MYGQEELTEIIRKTALYKCAVVERDAFEKGERRLLNLGHTFAHAIEKNCPIMHGEAVAIGLVLAAGVSERLGLAPAGLAVGLAEDLKKVGLPTQSPIAIGVLLEALEKIRRWRRCHSFHPAPCGGGGGGSCDSVKTVGGGRP